MDVHLIYNCRDYLLPLLCGPIPVLICNYLDLSIGNNSL